MRFQSSVAKICGHVFVVRTLVRFYGDESPTTNPDRVGMSVERYLVRFYGDESPTTNPLSTIFSQAHFNRSKRELLRLTFDA